MNTTLVRSGAVHFYGVLYQSISKKGTKVYPLYLKIAVECTQSCTKYIYCFMRIWDDDVVHVMLDT
jgi:hypothetical protein